ncbi:MAG: helix-turn-helix transcriptional regulator [Ruminococcaceae bacterium]|nr:helix-turn-helix transcriptional regulator [Oscillospiraceae bacterium]
MTGKTMGETISTRRKEKRMTQKQLAALLNITDKAVSKWERDLAYPDTQTLPKLAEVLGVTVEELLYTKAIPTNRRKNTEQLVDMVLKAVTTAMGTAVVVTSLVGSLDMKAGFTMIGIGLASVGIYLLKRMD